MNNDQSLTSGTVYYPYLYLIVFTLTIIMTKSYLSIDTYVTTVVVSIHWESKDRKRDMSQVFINSCVKPKTLSY